VSPWFILLWVLGPFVVFTAWLVIAQLRGRFGEPEQQQQRTKPDFLQRHATLLAIGLVLLAGASIGGVRGLLVSAVLLLVLGLLTAVILTFVEGRRYRSQVRVIQTSGEQLANLQLDPLPRRFIRNLRSAITEWPRYFA
jgi:hypothetical protein